MTRDIAKITLLCAASLTCLVLFLFFLDGFVSAMNNPTMCESLAKTFLELARCP